MWWALAGGGTAIAILWLVYWMGKKRGVGDERKKNAEHCAEVKDKQLEHAAAPRPGPDAVRERMRQGSM